MKELGNVGEKNKERPLCYSYSIKARSLLHAHLSRLNLPHTLESDKLVILSKCPFLLQEFIACCSQLTMLALAGRSKFCFQTMHFFFNALQHVNKKKEIKKIIHLNF